MQQACSECAPPRPSHLAVCRAAGRALWFQAEKPRDKEAASSVQMKTQTTTTTTTDRLNCFASRRACRAARCRCIRARVFFCRPREMVVPSPGGAAGWCCWRTRLAAHAPPPSVPRSVPREPRDSSTLHSHPLPSTPDRVGLGPCSRVSSLLPETLGPPRCPYATRLSPYSHRSAV